MKIASSAYIVARLGKCLIRLVMETAASFPGDQLASLCYTYVEVEFVIRSL